VRAAELHRERVVMRRALRGMRMALNMPVAAFDGISLWLMRVGLRLTLIRSHSRPPWAFG
jgi:hypothetical protein